MNQNKQEFADLLKEANDLLQKRNEEKRMLDYQMIKELRNRQKALMDILIKKDSERLTNHTSASE